jgi:DNA-binding transcriptional ArsR family regulator
MDASPAPRLLDVTALKALGHPLRVQLLDLLSRYGEQTASGLATRLGESSGSTSYHLRQLARHGLVEEAESHGSRRERWWRRPAGGFEVSMEAAEHDPAAKVLVRSVARQIEQQRATALAGFLDRGMEALPEEWLDASVLNTTNLRLDARQLKDISARTMEFLTQIADEYRGTGGPDARPVQLHFNAFPLIDPAAAPAPDSER